ncbi:NACHT domain-containing protein [Streptomyces sp. NPDC006658]|uniref:NACHT domain-containing protein n=1 Tax=Streptomyces sp. NPDC006658 TaxID=3156900 RepID=UPI003405FBDB
MPQVLDPGKIRTMDEFTAELRLLKAWAGSPSITEITRRVHEDWRRAGRPRTEWPARSTIGNCFRPGRRRPNSDLLLAVVRVLVGGDEATVALWRQTLRTVLGEAEAAARVRACDRLPAGPAPLPGRTRTATAVEAALTARPGTVVLEGAAGAGKTALALHVARHLAARSPAGTPVLFARLRGSAPDGPAADPAAVLETFLRLLGVTGDRIPHGVAARAALYRRLLAGTDAVVVLDDAADTEQIRPLLPGAPPCRTLVTSRRMMRALPGAIRRTVEPLAPDDAVDLLRQTAKAGPAATDTTALRRIADDLGHLPLALTAIGRHMREHTGWTLDDYHREAVLPLALEKGVRAALAATDARIEPEARTLLRLLALNPPAGTDTARAAALAGQCAPAVRRHLDALCAHHLLTEPEPGRFRMPALVRAYAAERIGIDLPATTIRQALHRVLADTGPTGAGAARALAA